MARSEATVEAEVKAPLDDGDAFRGRLIEQGASPAGSVRQVDRYFDHPTRDFGETDEALRVREQSGAIRLTYKGPRLDQATKSRTEFDVGVDDGERVADLLEALGFEHVATVIKDREIFSLADVTITLDEVEGLGTYAELEKIVAEEGLDKAREQLLALADDLELDELERRSYLELLLEKDGGAGTG